MNETGNRQSTGRPPHLGGDSMQPPPDEDHVNVLHCPGESHGIRDAARLGRKAIYIIGPSSSGKTTLCNAFAVDSGIPPSSYIKEIARNVMARQGFTRADVGTFEMQSAIMIAQLRAEAKSLEQDGSPTTNESPILLLSDRSAVDPAVYARSLGGPGGRDMQLKLLQHPEFQEALPIYRRSLFVMLNPVPEWIEDDGVRSLEDPWRYCNYLRDTLRELAIPFREIGEEMKDIGDRVRLVRRWAEA